LKTTTSADYDWCYIISWSVHVEADVMWNGALHLFMLYLLLIICLIH